MKFRHFIVISFIAMSTQLGAMQTTPEIQDKLNQALAIAQSNALTPDEKNQAVAQAKENVQRIVDTCGNDKELLKATLSQRIKYLLRTPFIGNVAMTLFTCIEFFLIVGILYGCVQGVNLLCGIELGFLSSNTLWFILTIRTIANNIWLQRFSY